jgi:hypothetical protein
MGRRCGLREPRVVVANLSGVEIGLEKAAAKDNPVQSMGYRLYNWRMRWDSNPRYACTYGGFQDRCLKPLGHPSRSSRNYAAIPHISSVDETPPTLSCLGFPPPPTQSPAS